MKSIGYFIAASKLAGNNLSNTYVHKDLPVEWPPIAPIHFIDYRHEGLQC
jgi:hypothetical protein